MKIDNAVICVFLFGLLVFMTLENLSSTKAQESTKILEPGQEEIPTGSVGLYSEMHSLILVRKYEDRHGGYHRYVDFEDPFHNQFYSADLPESLSRDWYAGLVVGRKYSVTFEQKRHYNNSSIIERFIWKYTEAK